MKFGLGVTTTPYREIHESIQRFLPKDCLLIIHSDENRIGVSKSRNNCIKYLYDQNCDYIAIMDDDVYLTYEGWFEYIVKAMEEANVHLSGLPSNFYGKHLSTVKEMSYWNSMIGAFHMMSRRFIEKVGYFNTEYDTYGSEDGAYQHRARRSGLIGRRGLPSALRSPFYIHSQDVYHMNPPQTLSKEEKDFYITKNHEIYMREISSKQIYYPYEQ